MEAERKAEGEGRLLMMDPEMEFLASKQETGNEWELYKENVRPLKRGRNVALLNAALKSHSSTLLKSQLLHHRRSLIEAIDEYQGDDPLQPWLQCIKWVEEAFPPGGDSSGLVVIYEQCVRSFWHHDRYRDDLRYLNVWLDYAANCTDAQVIYGFLEANKIGLTHASFYMSFALHMESKDKIRTADDIFNRGLSMNAQPIEKLKVAYKKFLNRSMGRPKALEEDRAENQFPTRSFGTVLANGEHRNQTDSSVFAKKKLKTDRVQGTTIPVYEDSGRSMILDVHSQNSKLDSKPGQILGVRAERNKENNPVPSKWTSNKIPQRFGHRTGETFATPSSIEIFVDDNCAETRRMDKETGKSSVVQLKQGNGGDLKKETELLRENPLRNFPPSSLPR